MPLQERKNEHQASVGAYIMPYEADIVRSLLEAYDIPVCPADYYTIYIKWLYANALGGIKIRVSEQDAADAREIIAGALEEGRKLQEVSSDGVCPRCGGSHTAPVVRGKSAAVITWLITGWPLVWPWTRLQCAACGQIWKAQQYPGESLAFDD